MKLVSKEYFDIGINKSGAWYWMPTWCASVDSLHTHENGRHFQWINTKSYYVATTIQLFWFRFIFYIQIKPKLLSGERAARWVRFEETHLDLLNLPEGAWHDADPS